MNLGPKRRYFVETLKTLMWAILIALVIRTFIFEPRSIPSGSMMPTLLEGDYLFISKYAYGYSQYSLPFSLPLIKERIFSKTPERGDVVVFRVPKVKADEYEQRLDYIKRVIGLPGDKIQVVDGQVVINGHKVPLKSIGSTQQLLNGDLDSAAAQAGLRIDARADYPIHGEIMIETLPGSTGTPDVRHWILRDHRSEKIKTQYAEKMRNHGFTPDHTAEFLIPPGHVFVMGDNRNHSNDGRDDGNLKTAWFLPMNHLIGRAEFISFSVDGTAALWEFWKWPQAIRFSRMFDRIR